MNVKFYIVTARDGQTARERYDAMAKESTSFYAVENDLFFGYYKITNNQDVMNILSKIGTVPDETDLVSMIMDVAYDDTALQSRVTANEDAIELLNRTDGSEGSVKKIVDDAIAAIIADAPDSFDTLKEISDWISTHTNDAAEMNAQIQANKAAIGEPTIPDEQLGTGLYRTTEILDARVTALEAGGGGGGGGGGTAASVSIADVGEHYNSNNVEGALQEIGNALTWEIY